jgi:hypothetical protein
MKKVGLVLLAAMLMAGCGQRVNTSSPDAYGKSIEAMVKDLSADKQAELKDSLIAITFNTAEPETGIWSQAEPTAPVFLGAKDKINGLTADQIIKLGYETRIKLLDQKIADDAASAQRYQAARAKVADVFQGVKIDNAQYRVDKGALDIERPQIMLHITNGSKRPIKTIDVRGVLTSPGRAVPWVSSAFNYEFPGGLEPGESQSLTLEPNMFDDWKAQDSFSHRTDLHLDLTLINAAGADGTKLIDETMVDDKTATAEATKLQGERNDLAARLAKL